MALFYKEIQTIIKNKGQIKPSTTTASAVTVLTDLSVAALLLGHEANGSAMICMLNEQVMLFDVNNVTFVLFFQLQPLTW